MFAIVRMQKLKTESKLAQRARHHLRETEVSNADETRSGNNRTSWRGTAAGLVKAIWDRVEPLVKRKDAVRAIEVLLTASPEWFGPGKAKLLTEQAAGFLVDTFGAENLTAFGLHMDEKSPHVWAFITPVHEGKLKASQWLDGPAKMRKIQDDWAARMAPHGLQRGIKGSKARHVDIKTYYAAVNGDQTAAEYVAREQMRRAAWHRQRAAEAADQAREQRARIVDALDAMPTADRERVAAALGLQAGPATSRQAQPEGRGMRVRAPLAPVSFEVKKAGPRL